MLRKLALLVGLTTVLFGSALIYAPTVGAVDVIGPACNNENIAGGQTPAVCKDNNSNSGNPIFGPDGILTTYISVLSFAVGLIAILMIFFGAIKFITSAGDPQSVSSAQKTVLFAIVGLIVAALTQAIVIFVLSKINS